jgi:phosphopantetheine adenylyltransferase
MSNSFPRIILPISADPMHFGHINIKNIAENQIGEKVYFLICRNYNKNKGLFSVEERVDIAKLYCPEEKIFFSEDKKEIGDYLSDAKIIVKGFRSLKEYEDFLNLSNIYNVDCDCFRSKILYVKVPDDFCSSLNIKNFVKAGKINLVESFVLPDVIKKIERKFASFFEKKDLNSCINKLF